MATTSPARIDDELFASAKLAGSVQSRSAAQQVAHWARIGREIEASGSLSVKDVHEVLAGSRSYDSLTAEQQAEVRAEWAMRMDERRASLDLAAAFTEAGRTWVELDDEGDVVQRGTAPAGNAHSAAPRRRTAKRAASVKQTTAGKARKTAKSAQTAVAKKARSQSAGAPSRVTKAAATRARAAG